MSRSAAAVTSSDRPLAGRRIVVTRARPGRLDEALGALGAEVVAAPVIATADPTDGGAALARAVGELRDGRYDWVVLTSAVGVARLCAALPDASGFGGARVAVVGPGTAAALARHGVTADLVPEVAVGEGLVEAFPTGTGRILQVRPEVARAIVPRGIAAKGWTVDEVIAYRTVPVAVDDAARVSIRGADAVTFTSTSTVDHLVAAVGVDGLPPRTVSIGPVTSAALEAHGLTPTNEASPHTVDGLVAAVVAALTAG